MELTLILFVTVLYVAIVGAGCLSARWKERRRKQWHAGAAHRGPEVDQRFE